MEQQNVGVSGAGEGLNDIQSYIANFSKEIGTDSAPAILFAPGSEPGQVQFSSQEQLFSNVSRLGLKWVLESQNPVRFQRRTGYFRAAWVLGSYCKCLSMTLPPLSMGCTIIFSS